jgi:hypothetical protein
VLKGGQAREEWGTPKPWNRGSKESKHPHFQKPGKSRTPAVNALTKIRAANQDQKLSCTKIKTKKPLLRRASGRGQAMLLR